jgi:hypothetical protein
MTKLADELQLISAMDVIGIARKFLDDAKYPYYFIEQVKLRGDYIWDVVATTTENKLYLRIDVKGNVMSMEMLKKQKSVGSD